MKEYNRRPTGSSKQKYVFITSDSCVTVLRSKVILHGASRNCRLLVDLVGLRVTKNRKRSVVLDFSRMSPLTVYVEEHIGDGSPLPKPVVSINGVLRDLYFRQSLSLKLKNVWLSATDEHIELNVQNARWEIDPFH